MRSSILMFAAQQASRLSAAQLISICGKVSGNDTPNTLLCRQRVVLLVNWMRGRSMFTVYLPLDATTRSTAAITRQQMQLTLRIAPAILIPYAAGGITLRLERRRRRTGVTSREQYCHQPGRQTSCCNDLRRAWFQTLRR